MTVIRGIVTYNIIQQKITTNDKVSNNSTPQQCSMFHNIHHHQTIEHLLRQTITYLDAFFDFFLLDCFTDFDVDDFFLFPFTFPLPAALSSLDISELTSKYTSTQVHKYKNIKQHNRQHHRHQQTTSSQQQFNTPNNVPQHTSPPNNRVQCWDKPSLLFL